jgi:hypothetical protein
MSDATVKDDPQKEKGIFATPAALRNGPSWTGAVIMSVIVSIGMSLLAVWFYDFKFAQKIVSVDIKGYTATIGNEFLTGKITEAQFRQKFDHLQTVVESIPSNKAVLLGDLVVRNVQKITP